MYIWDTKFEFWLDDKGDLVLIDEIFTQDSSRFTEIDWFKPGWPAKSADKQFVRDYIEKICHTERPRSDNEKYPITLSDEVRKQTEENYARHRIAFS